MKMRGSVKWRVSDRMNEISSTNRIEILSEYSITNNYFTHTTASGRPSLI